MSEPSMDLVCVACGRDYGAHIGDYCHPPAARSVPPSMFTPAPDPRDAEIAALRGRVEQLTDCHAGPGTTSPACGACSTCWANVVERLETRVAALEAVERAAREYREKATFCLHSPDCTIQDEEERDALELALDAALAALEVPRG